MSGSLVLLGGGEHAQVVAEAARLAGWSVRGCVAPSAPSTANGLPWLGPDEAWQPQPDDRHLLVAVGAPGTPLRHDLAVRFADLAWATIIHPAAIVSPSAAIAPGAFIAAGAIVGTRTSLARHAIVNTGAQADHDCRIGTGAHLAPGAILGGGVAVGDWAFIGLGARVRDHRAIGAGAIVGMGSVVLAHVPAGATVYGVPAEARP